MNQNIINQMKRYQHKKEIVKAVKYQEGMEDGWMILLPDMLDGDDFVNRVFNSQDEAMRYTTTSAFYDYKDYDIVPVMLSILADDEVETCSHVVTGDNRFEYEFTEINEDDWLVIDEYGCERVIDSDDFYDMYEVINERGTNCMKQVNNKFEIGQEVFLITERKERIENKCTCDVCLGLGTVTYKGYEMECPKCHGRKEIVLDSKVVTVHTADVMPYRVVSYRYTVCKDGEFLRYRLKQDYKKEKSVLEEEIFASREDAVKACDDKDMFTTYDEWGKQLLDDGGAK